VELEWEGDTFRWPPEPRPLRVTFKWGGDTFDVEVQDMPDALRPIVREAARILVQTARAARDGKPPPALDAAAFPPGAPGHAFLARVARRAAKRAGELTTGALVQRKLVELLESMQGREEEVLA
jgi:hypothetical protein